MSDIVKGGILAGLIYLLWPRKKSTGTITSGGQTNSFVATITITAIDPVSKSVQFHMVAPNGATFADTYYDGDTLQSITDDGIYYFISAPTDGSDGPTLSIEQKMNDGSMHVLVATSISYDYPQSALPDIEKQS